MTDSRARSDVGALSLARRFLGRVLDTVRGAEPIVELVPDAPSTRVRAVEPQVRAAESIDRVEPIPAPRSVALVRVLDLEPMPTAETEGDDRVVALPDPSLVPSIDEPARALLADASWSGLRTEQRDAQALLAWRDVDQTADVLRTIEIRCAYGALDAAPEVSVRDRPISSTLGAITLASDAVRWVVALGSLRDGAFVSVAHATLR